MSSSSSSSSLCALPTVIVRACVFQSGVDILSRMIQPPPYAGIFDDKIKVHTVVAGVVDMLLFQGAWYDIWYTGGLPMRYRVPETSESLITIDPILPNDEECQ